MALPLTKQVVSKTNETRELQQELQAIVDEKLLPAVGRMEAALEKLEHGEYDELWRTKKLEDSVTAVLSTLGCVAYGQSEDHSQWLPKVHWDLASDLKGLDKDGRAINDEAFRRLEEHCATPLLQSTTSTSCGSRRVAQLLEQWLLGYKDYATTSRELKPRMLQLQQLQRELQELGEQLIHKRAQAGC
mmetsp:Transcript_36016/g.84229  ORF Transcript_36016/g.84229 Transcript_36016/m.84229 type:complete len:188 (+) Transcript_36016:94-657(+)|eukprot:s41_g10.t1